MRVNMTNNENTAGVQMKNVGFIRKADSPGRIVIPKEICKIPAALTLVLYRLCIGRTDS